MQKKSVSSRAILGRSLRASRPKVLWWLASVTVPGPALIRGSRLFWCCAAARLRVAWRAVLSAWRARVVGGPFAWGQADV